MKKLAALAACAALAIPAAAQAEVTITTGATYDVLVPDNNFAAELAGLGLTHYTTTGADIFLAAGQWSIVFELLGSESGYSDSFTAGGVSYTENTSFIPWGSTVIGGDLFTGGTSLAGILNFTSLGGLAATVGEAGFGIFLTEKQASGSSFNTSVFYLGYDDQITSPDDDNHDDLIIRATVTAVPEPSTWGLMILGFGALGMAMRGSRRREGTAIGKIKFA